MKTLKEVVEQIEENWIVEYEDWSMLVVEGKRKEFRLYHHCKDRRDASMCFLGICNACHTEMPEKARNHFKKTQTFIEPSRAEWMEP